MHQMTETQLVPAAETEVQKLLIDERIRCESHKTNYQILKAEHTRLQNENIKAQNECKRLLVENQSTHEKFKLQLADLRGEFLEKAREVEELKGQVLSPYKLELLKAQIQQELEAPMKKRFQRLEEERERYREAYNKLRYEHTIEMTQLQHQKEEQERVLEEQKIKYNAEISRLEREKEELRNQITAVDPTRDGKRVEVLLREKSQLIQKLKGLEAEVTELHAERENCGTQALNVQRIQVRQMAEAQGTIRSLEEEKSSVKQQLERLEKELNLTSEENTILTTKLHKTEREVDALTIQVDDLKHSHKIEIANIKLEATRLKNEAESERDKVHSQFEVIKTENEILRATLDRQKELLVEKERELIRKVQSAKEEGFQQVATLQDERLEFKNRIAELERFKIKQDNQKQSELNQLKEKLRIIQATEVSTRRELESLRSKLQQQIACTEQLQKEKQDEADLKQEIHELQIQVTSLSESENTLLHSNEKLRDMVERLKQENRSARNQAEKAQQDAEKILEGSRIEWLEEKHKLQEELLEFQEKYSCAKGKLQRAADAQKKRKNLNENRFKRLHQKIELLEAKKDELEMQKHVYSKQYIPQEEFSRVQKRLKDFQRRHNEFRSLLLGPNVPIIGPLNPVSYLPSTIIPGMDFSFRNAQEEQHQKELSLVRKRLEELETSQMNLLEELGPPSEQSKLEASGLALHQKTNEEADISELAKL